ncbi:hypothetical protein [Nguyenibacter sp. L1]|uniref:hypothetical protein n=1 Tax=Nguyenibacter sp. L1 TaxID=3049350 RepID=UPI002B460998|nr:hypothetical protein [Nguyenibacter sp. L1]WRH87420.1 hypothetical protein QN315_15810 [Nguyenibacter sp. L1]
MTTMDPHQTRATAESRNARSIEIGPWDDRQDCAAWLDAFLSEEGLTRGYGYLLRRAADKGLYDVVRSWGHTDRPAPVDATTIEILLPQKIIMEAAQGSAATSEEIVARLSCALPVAVRRHITRKRFNRYGHIGCTGEDPMRR